MALPPYILASVLAFSLFFGTVSADYSGQQEASKPSPDTYQQQPEEDDFGGFKVQGLIYCRKHGKLIPLGGAMAKIRCVAEDDDGNDAGEFSVVSQGSDSKGYFGINISKYALEGITLSRCRVHLESHPPGICRIRTNVNEGLTGAPLLQYRTLSDNSRLYSVHPFVYDASPYY